MACLRLRPKQPNLKCLFVKRGHKEVNKKTPLLDKSLRAGLDFYFS